MYVGRSGKIDVKELGRKVVNWHSVITRIRGTLRELYELKESQNIKVGGKKKDSGGGKLGCTRGWVARN